MTTRIWVDRNRIAGDKATGERSPVFKVKRSTGIVRATEVEVRVGGRVVARLVYDPRGSCASAVLEILDGPETEVELR